MKIVIISDTHEQEDKIEEVPEGDVLIHCGDITGNGSLKKLEKFAKWMCALPHKNKLVICGNHEVGCSGYKNAEMRFIFEENSIIYLEDSGIEIDGLYFWGTPWQPEFYSWEFNLPRGKALAEKWSKIPSKTNILITHGPPFGILDAAPRDFGEVEYVGCQDLLQRIKQLNELKLCCFGHIHASYGILEQDGVKFVNAAICNEDYEPINKPVVVEIEAPQEKINKKNDRSQKEIL